MKIAIFTNNYLPNPYGVTTSVESFRKEFEKDGHQVYIFAPNYLNYKDKNKNVFRYPALDIKYKIKFPVPIPYSNKLGRLIANLDIDIIHSQHPNLLGSVAMRWAKKKKIPLVFTWHTIYDKYTHYTPLVPRKLANYWVIRNSVRYANRVNRIIIPTEGVYEIINNWGNTNTNVSVIATGVDEEIFKNPQENKIKETLGIVKDKIVLLSISRLTEEKNVIFLIREVVKVLKKNKQAVFILGGDGYLKDELIKIINQAGVGEQVFLLGLVERDQIKNYLNIADIFVYASLSETQGTIITEAMYGGLPIVALDGLGIRDLIKHRKTGILVKKNSTFARQINKLIANTELTQALGQNAKQEAQKKYTSRVCAKKMLKIYQDLIAKNNLSR